MHDPDGLALHEAFQQLQGEVVRPGMKVDRDGLVPQRLHMRQGRESGRTTMACETIAGRSVTIRPPWVLASARRTWPHSQALKAVAACASKAVYCQKGGTWPGSVSSGWCASQGVCGRNTTSRPSWANNPVSWATSHGRSKTA